MRVRHLVIPLAVGLGLAACGDEPESGGSEQLRWTTQEQIHTQEPAPRGAQATVGPEQRTREFFDAVRSGQPEQAAAMISQQSRQVSGASLEQSLRQWASGPAGTEQNFQIIDSLQQGDFALVRVRFPASSGDPTQPDVRPVVLFRDEAEWLVVWDLIGMLPDQVAQTDPQTADRLDPLYTWYVSQQRTSVNTAQQQGGQQQGTQAQQGGQQQQEATDRQSGQQQQGAQTQSSGQQQAAPQAQQAGSDSGQPSS